MKLPVRLVPTKLFRLIKLLFYKGFVNNVYMNNIIIYIEKLFII